MNCSYEDIRSRIREEPGWWDERAVPRYCAFAPDELANIYADECALVLIRCQQCRIDFKVAFSGDSMRMGAWNTDGTRRWLIAEQIGEGRLHYGDPPNIACCTAGATMNCLDIQVLEYWRKCMERGEHFLEWQRDATFEVELEDARHDGVAED
jgi:hypothetical protein